MEHNWPGAPNNLNLLHCSERELVDSVYALKDTFTLEGWSEVANSYDIPRSELETSPLSSRIAWRAATQGAVFAHHELKSALPLPHHLGPEGSAAQASGWVGGALIEPRHFSFGQDHRIQTFHPNHRAQWRPHELAHALSGFFWHPQLTRFELYLSARVNELLPIIHWYGWDRISRPACPLHSRVETYREHCEDCASLASTPWWQSSQSVSQEQDLFWATHGLDHFRREWQAINEEYDSGTRVKTPRGPLDASSDALGYLDGHWNRSTSWGFGRWVETCLKPGVDYYADFTHWLSSHLELHTGLFTENLSFTPLESERFKWRRIIQDMGYRVMMTLEHLPEESGAANECESILASWLDDVHQHVAVEDASQSTLRELAENWLSFLPAIQQHLPPKISETLAGLGIREVPPTLNIQQLKRGLHAVEVECDDSEVMEFVHSAAFPKEGFLIERWAEFQPSREHEDAAFYQQACGRDADGEIFAALPDLDESIPLSELRLNTTAQWRQSPDGEWDCAFSWHGEVRLITCSQSDYEWIQTPNPEGVPNELGTWLEMGLLIWLPTPRGRTQP